MAESKTAENRSENRSGDKSGGKSGKRSKSFSYEGDELRAQPGNFQIWLTNAIEKYGYAIEQVTAVSYDGEDVLTITVPELSPDGAVQTDGTEKVKDANDKEVVRPKSKMQELELHSVAPMVENEKPDAAGSKEAGSMTAADAEPVGER